MNFLPAPSVTMVRISPEKGSSTPCPLLHELPPRALGYDGANLPRKGLVDALLLQVDRDTSVKVDSLPGYRRSREVERGLEVFPLPLHLLVLRVLLLHRLVQFSRLDAIVLPPAWGPLHAHEQVIIPAHFHCLA